MAYWSPFPDMDSSEVTNTGFIDQLKQQQEVNPACSEDASTSLNDGFQHFLADPTSAMPLFPDPFGQVELDENFGINFMTEDFSWMNQRDFTTTDVVSHQAEVQPGANTPWPGAPFEVDQSGLHFAHQEMPEMPQMGKMPSECMNMQFPTNQPVEGSPGATNIPVSAGSAIIPHQDGDPVALPTGPIGEPLPSLFESDHAGAGAGHSLHVQRGNRYHCLFQPCNKSFTRETDLFRHQNGHHLQAITYWCSSANCERGVAGRPFPRKDKRNEHERKVHGITRPRGQ